MVFGNPNRLRVVTWTQEKWNAKQNTSAYFPIQLFALVCMAEKVSGERESHLSVAILGFLFLAQPRLIDALPDPYD